MQKNLWDAAYNAGTSGSAQPFPQSSSASHAKNARSLRGFVLFYQYVSSDRHLGTHLDHSPGWYLKKVGGIARRPRQRNEQVILP
jgi:hypothetical protein